MLTHSEELRERGKQHPWGTSAICCLNCPQSARCEPCGIEFIAVTVAVLVYNYFLRRLQLTATDLDDFARDFQPGAETLVPRVATPDAGQVWGDCHRAES